MKLTIENPNGDKIYQCIDNAKVIGELLGILFNKTIVKSKGTRIKYQYNYSNEQKIIIAWPNGTKSIFEGIPTKLGYLDTDKIIKTIKESEVK